MERSNAKITETASCFQRSDYVNGLMTSEHNKISVLPAFLFFFSFSRLSFFSSSSYLEVTLNSIAVSFSMNLKLLTKQVLNICKLLLNIYVVASFACNISLINTLSQKRNILLFVSNLQLIIFLCHFLTLAFSKLKDSILSFK